MSSFLVFGGKRHLWVFSDHPNVYALFYDSAFRGGLSPSTSLLNSSPALNVHLMADIWGPSSLVCRRHLRPADQSIGGSSELNCLYRLGTVRYLKALITHIVPSKMSFHMEIYCFVKSDKNGTENREYVSTNEFYAELILDNM